MIARRTIKIELTLSIFTSESAQTTQARAETLSKELLERACDAVERTARVTETERSACTLAANERELHDRETKRRVE